MRKTRHRSFLLFISGVSLFGWLFWLDLMQTLSRRLGVFPANYALDLGEFIDSNGNSYIDIVELNPISCSMCYVNNSIYADVVPEIGECQRQLMMGAEFCYDAIANPKNYDMLRISNKSYTYTSDNQYALLQFAYHRGFQSNSGSDACFFLCIKSPIE